MEQTKTEITIFNLQTCSNTVQTSWIASTGVYLFGIGVPILVIGVLGGILGKAMHDRKGKNSTFYKEAKRAME